MLKDYTKKRHFSHTPEPAPHQEEGAGPLIFVVHKHASRRLHYDFRLEVAGVLKSWAIPKGPSLNPKEKRLAIMVEDHPLDYATFEGTIPEGEYGAGQVTIWDHGIYSPEENGRDAFDSHSRAQEWMQEGLDTGKISILLRGERLQGSWSLVRMRDSQNWLLIKHEDEFALPERDSKR